MKKITNHAVLVLISLAISLFVGCAVLAWTEPSSLAPSGNVAAPINTGSTSQTKIGPLIIGDTNWSQLQFSPSVNDTYNPISGGSDRAHFHFTFPNTPGGKEPLIETPADFWVIGANHNLVADGYVRTNTGLCISGDCRTSWGSITGPWTVSGTNIYNNNTGNVGIGTAGPGYKLDVAGDIRGTSLLVSGGGSWVDGSIYSDANWGMLFRPKVAGAQAAYAFYNYGGLSELMRIRNDGNVGIGAASPGYKLQVNGDIYANGGWLRTSGDAGWYSESYGGGWYMSDTSWIRSYNQKNIWLGAGLLGSNGGMTIGYGGAGSPSGGAIIAGNVGIGTASPGAKLHVAGNLLLDSTLHGAGRPVDWANINGGSYAGNSYYAYASMCVNNASGYCDASGGVVLGRTNASATTNFPSSGNSFINAGNVGIGTAAPLAALHVKSHGSGLYGGLLVDGPIGPWGFVSGGDGSMWIGSNSGNWFVLSTSGNITIPGTATASAFYYTSDASLKKNIAGIKEPIEKINSLNGVSFEWKDSGESSIGLIAQDVEKVFPQAVTTNTQTGLKSVDYGKMVAPLIEAIKAQQIEIKELKSRIDELESKIGTHAD